VFDNNSWCELISEYMTPSLEAFVILVYVNNHESWFKEWVEKTIGPEDERVLSEGEEGETPPAEGGDKRKASPCAPAGGEEAGGGTGTVTPSMSSSKKKIKYISNKKYTSNGRGSGKYKGWQQGAMELYNEIELVVSKQRKHSPYFDKSLRDMFKQDRQPGRRQIQEQGLPEVRARNSLLLLYPHLADNDENDTGGGDGAGGEEQQEESEEGEEEEDIEDEEEEVGHPSADGYEDESEMEEDDDKENDVPVPAARKGVLGQFRTARV
jgi:hypothetical protein